MKQFDSPLKNIAWLAYRWINPIFDPIRFFHALKGYFWFTRDYVRFRAMGTDMPLRFRDSYPILTDKMPTTPFDSHYFYQNVWATRRISANPHPEHMDVGSSIDMMSLLSVFKPVVFVDIRPLEVDLPNFRSLKGDIMDLPFESGSVPSLSSLNVAEHIGLGRYGDTIDPEGTIRATRELTRVLKPGGDLYFSLPVGRERICFNAHRVHLPSTILGYFQSLDLIEFSVITDDRVLLEHVNPDSASSYHFACGLFHFRKPSNSS